MSELISYCHACGEYGHRVHCGLEYLDAKADTDVWRTECNILKQTIKNLETGHQKELAEARARVAKAEDVIKFYAAPEQWTIQALEGNHGDWGNKARAYIKACEEKEPTA